MNVTGSHLQVLAVSLIEARRARDEERARELAEELFDVGRELSLYPRPRGRRASMSHRQRGLAAMALWRLRQVFRRPVTP